MLSDFGGVFVEDDVRIVGQPLAGFEKRQMQVLHYQVDGSAIFATYIAAIAVFTDVEVQRRMTVVVKRTEADVPADAESQSLSDPLDGEVDKLLNLIVSDHTCF